MGREDKNGRRSGGGGGVREESLILSQIQSAKMLEAPGFYAITLYDYSQGIDQCDSKISKP